ncbi:MAG: 4Fe-4S binding protein [Chloroflexi bacterium]|nr:4Fe-4S binding protein [Chloroflexota bacterium]
MPILPSTRKFWQEANRIKNYPLTEKIHGFLYLSFPFFYIATGTGSNRLGKFGQRVIALVNRFFPRKSARPGQITFPDTYHGKVVPLHSARELVSIKENIRIDDLEKVIPYQLARSIVIAHPQALVALDCPCRVARENPCLPLDVCLIVGEPFASFTLEHHPKRSRSITREVAIAILEAEDARGHVHHAFFKEAVLQRFYAICNCCSCCCGAMQAHQSGTPMLASSGYSAQVDQTECLGCGECNSYCQFNALSMEEGVSHVNLEKCMGCGVCVSHCEHNAIQLILNSEKGIPLEMSRYHTSDGSETFQIS